MCFISLAFLINCLNILSLKLSAVSHVNFDIMAAMGAVVLFIALGLLLYTGNVEVIENRNDFDKFLQKKGLKVSHQNIRGLWLLIICCNIMKYIIYIITGNIYYDT